MRRFFWGVDLPEEKGANPQLLLLLTTDAPGATTAIETPSLIKAAQIMPGPTSRLLCHEQRAESFYSSPETTSISPPTDPPT